MQQDATKLADLKRARCSGRVHSLVLIGIARRSSSGFVVRFCSGDPSVDHRHGIDNEDIQHCVENAVVIEEVSEDPVRYLVLDSDRVGNLLELMSWIGLRDRP